MDEWNVTFCHHKTQAKEHIEFLKIKSRCLKCSNWLITNLFFKTGRNTVKFWLDEAGFHSILIFELQVEHTLAEALLVPRQETSISGRDKLPQAQGIISVLEELRIPEAHNFQGFWFSQYHVVAGIFVVILILKNFQEPAIVSWKLAKSMTGSSLYICFYDFSNKVMR